MENYHYALLALIYFSFFYTELQNSFSLQEKTKTATSRNPTSKSHSAVEEFGNARDAKLPWDHPLLYLLMTPAVIPFGLCATSHCCDMIHSLQLPNTVQGTFFCPQLTTLRNLIVLQGFFPSLCSFSSQAHSYFKPMQRLHPNPLKSLLWDHTESHLALDKLPCP